MLINSQHNSQFEQRADISPDRIIDLHMLLAGIFILLVGISVYIFFRKGCFFLKGYNLLHNSILLKKMLGVMPSFVHVLSFILITNSLNILNNKIVCMYWFFINCFFEIGQFYKIFFIFEYNSSNIVIIDLIKLWNNFFLNGTFDRFDLVASFCGMILAYQLTGCNFNTKFRRRG